MEPQELEEQTVAVIVELFGSNVLNVNVMSQRINTSLVQSYTWFPYAGQHCASAFTRLHILDECEFIPEGDDGSPSEYRIKSYKKGWEKIPDQFHNCPLKVPIIVYRAE